LAAEGDDLESVVIALQTDLSLAGVYGEEWLVSTSDCLRVFSSNGGVSQDGQLKARLSLPLSELRSPRTESLVGGGALLAVVDGKTIELVRFTKTRQRAFERVTRYLSDLANYHEALGGDRNEAEKPVFVEYTDLATRCPRCRLILLPGTTACPACMNKVRVLVRLARYLKPYASETTLLSLLMLASTTLGLVAPYLTRPLMDVVLVPRGQPLSLEVRFFWLGIIVLGMLASQVLSQVINIAHGRIAVRLTHQLAHSMRVELYQHLQQLSLSFFDKRQVGALTTRVTQDTEELESVLSTGAQFFLANMLTLAGIIVVLCFLNWRVFLMVLIPIPLVVFLTRLFWGKLQTLWPRWWHFRSSLNSVITENFSGMRLIKSFAQEEREASRFEPRSYDLSSAAIRAEQTWMTVFPIVTLITGLGALIVWYLGGRQVLLGNLTLGTLVTFIAYLSMFYGPLQFVNRFSGWLGRALAAADRVFDILDNAPDVPDSPAPTELARPQGRVEFKDVIFGYDPHKPVLQDFNLEVEPGEMIGLVGHSGAGKSTTINLLCRLYDVNEGQILIDGIDVKQIRQKDLRRHFGIVMQDAFLFNSSIAENITYSKPSATREEVIVAAKAANAHDFIAAKPDGYDTIVGERGNSLSFGERQRISIARAILPNPRFLILDEATSAVDTDTEKQIQDAIARVVKGRTTFAIAHRLSTLRNANRVVVIKGGKIEEVGTHDELMLKKGEFYRLVEMQREMSSITVVDG
jgi:ATP-binding cassette subfamily B protein